MWPRGLPNRNESDEDELTAALAAGEATALDEMLRRYWPRIVRFASHIAGCDDLAEDIAQDAFVQLWQWRARLTSGGSVAAFLHRVARNLALNEVRNRAVRDRQVRAIGASHDTVVSPPDEVLEVRGLEHAIDRAIAALPARQRTVFVMARYEGLTHQEIARILGTSPQTVANQMTSALVRLRDALRPLRDVSVSRIAVRPGQFRTRSG
jgi:RNA polymerase sigma-19 factor, ECF subfamily